MREREAMYKLDLVQKEMDVLRAVIDTQEIERDKIARNLHDEVGPLISSLKLKVTKHQRDLKKGELQPDDLNDERELSDVIMENVRSVSHDLSPHFLHKHGLIKALEQYFGNLEGIDINFNVNFEEDQDLQGKTALNVYRMVLEILNNVMKHDQSKQVEVNLERKGNGLLVRIEHDGEGISNEEFVRLVKNGDGLGLESLQARTIILNGNLDYQKSPARVNLKIVLDHGEED
jgi:signal transduction histidine kinase